MADSFIVGVQEIHISLNQKAQNMLSYWYKSCNALVAIVRALRSADRYGVYSQAIIILEETIGDVGSENIQTCRASQKPSVANTLQRGD